MLSFVHTCLILALNKIYSGYKTSHFPVASQERSGEGGGERREGDSYASGSHSEGN